jgi:hypothetical protein
MEYRIETNGMILSSNGQDISSVYGIFGFIYDSSTKMILKHGDYNIVRETMAQYTSAFISSTQNPVSDKLKDILSEMMDSISLYGVFISHIDYIVLEAINIAITTTGRAEPLVALLESRAVGGKKAI